MTSKIDYTKLQKRIEASLNEAKKIMTITRNGGYAMGYSKNTLPPYPVGLFGALAIMEGEDIRSKLGLSFAETQALEKGFNGSGMYEPLYASYTKKPKKAKKEPHILLVQLGSKIYNNCLNIPKPRLGRSSKKSEATPYEIVVERMRQIIDVDLQVAAAPAPAVEHLENEPNEVEWEASAGEPEEAHGEVWEGEEMEPQMPIPYPAPIQQEVPLNNAPARLSPEYIRWRGDTRYVRSPRIGQGHINHPAENSAVGTAQENYPLADNAWNGLGEEDLQYEEWVARRFGVVEDTRTAQINHPAENPFVSVDRPAPLASDNNTTWNRLTPTAMEWRTITSTITSPNDPYMIYAYPSPREAVEVPEHIEVNIAVDANTDFDIRDED